MFNKISNKSNKLEKEMIYQKISWNKLMKIKRWNSIPSVGRLLWVIDYCSWRAQEHPSIELSTYKAITHALFKDKRVLQIALKSSCFGNSLIVNYQPSSVITICTFTTTLYHRSHPLDEKKIAHTHHHQRRRFYKTRSWFGNVSGSFPCHIPSFNCTYCRCRFN